MTRLRDYLTDYGLGHVTLDDFFTGDDEFTVVFVPRCFQPAGDTFDDRYCFVGPTTTAPPARRRGIRRPADTRCC